MPNMSGTAAEQDNSIEEILASIRQIISEDEPAKTEAAPAPADAPSPPPAPPPPPIEPVAPSVTAEDVFELVDRVVAEEDEEAVLSAATAPEPAAPTPLPVPLPDVDAVKADVFSEVASNATLGAFAKLSDTISMERQKNVANAVTLEDIVKDLLSPLLRQWIDQHVPAIVERLVTEQLEKLARQAREG